MSWSSFHQAERLFRSIIFRIARRHQVDPAMLQAIIMAESGFNPNAISQQGAAGLMQLINLKLYPARFDASAFIE